MRTTVTIDDHLYEEAKVLAARSHGSVGSVISEALRRFVAESNSVEADALPDLPRWKGGQVKPGIDINDTSAVLAKLDEGRGIDVLR
jgi:predicted transcriptional regulator